MCSDGLCVTVACGIVVSEGGTIRRRVEFCLFSVTSMRLMAAQDNKHRRVVHEEFCLFSVANMSDGCMEGHLTGRRCL